MVCYPEFPNLASARILAKIGDAPQKWYSYTNFVEYDGAEEYFHYSQAGRCH